MNWLCLVMEQANKRPEQIVANGGWVEVKCRCRPKTERFRMLALLWFLPSAGALFIIGRITHAIGMDGNFRAGRPIGMLTAQLFQLALIVACVLIAARVI